MALLETVPYLAFAGAGLLVVFVGGEYALKKWKARGVKKPAPAAPEESSRGLVSKPEPLSARAPAVAVSAETPVAEPSGSYQPVEVFDESESVRIAEVAMLHVSGGDSGRIPELAPESARAVAVNMAVEVVSEVEDTPKYLTGADTERCPAVRSEDVLAAAKAVDELDVQGVVCTDVIAARRDPSVRVFDAVVAPSERKNSAA
jgi:hypothetical protein